MDPNRKQELRQEILELVGQYYEEAFPKPHFLGGISSVPVTGKVFDATEIQYLVDSALDFWLTSGRFAETFESQFAGVMGVRHALLCNSGSSANLLAMSALSSDRLGDRRMYPGDEVITVAVGFPTTVNPIFQNQFVPVFVDPEIGTYNASLEKVAAAVGPKTKAIFIAHTLGNPFEVEEMKTFATENNLWLIEDCADAVGAKYNGKEVGSFGDIATASFYPAHHITMGEGGAVVTNSGSIKKIVESFRDWGRDCWCPPGHDNTCGRRFDWQIGDLPYGYDHKYTYSHIGFNLKATDMQAAIGVAQLEKLPNFIKQRNKNWHALFQILKETEQRLILPFASAKAEPSWFGFPITVKQDAPFTRLELIQHLEENRIATRLLFGGNLIRQPAYKNMRFRVHGELDNADLITHQTFWVGVYPGLSDEAIEFIGKTIVEFVKSKG
jgi:CDP-6-deoxy-D-xylo-4-hexulose-3-dehydrase